MSSSLPITPSSRSAACPGSGSPGSLGPARPLVSHSTPSSKPLAAVLPHGVQKRQCLELCSPPPWLSRTTVTSQDPGSLSHAGNCPRGSGGSLPSFPSLKIMVTHSWLSSHCPEVPHTYRPGTWLSMEEAHQELLTELLAPCQAVSQRLTPTQVSCSSLWGGRVRWGGQPARTCVQDSIRLDRGPPKLGKSQTQCLAHEGM